MSRNQSRMKTDPPPRLENHFVVQFVLSQKLLIAHGVRLVKAVKILKTQHQCIRQTLCTLKIEHETFNPLLQ